MAGCSCSNHLEAVDGVGAGGGEAAVDLVQARGMVEAVA